MWAQDEHRLGLLPVVRRIWAPRGSRPTAPVRRRFRWLYVYGFVRPATGATWWCLLPTVRADAFALALAAFARDEGIDPVFLPAYSPELQPAERLWGLVDEAVANRVFPDLDALERTLVARCRTLRGQRRRVKRRTRYHWWPRERRPRNPK